MLRCDTKFSIPAGPLTKRQPKTLRAFPRSFPEGKLRNRHTLRHPTLQTMGGEVLDEATQPVQHEFDKFHSWLAVYKRLLRLNFPVSRKIFNPGQRPPVVIDSVAGLYEAFGPRSARFPQIVRESRVGGLENLKTSLIGRLLLEHKTDLLTHLSAESFHAFLEGAGGRINEAF